MPRRAVRKPAPVPEPGVPPEEPPLADDDFVGQLKRELTKTQQTAGAKTGEDLSARADLNKRLLQDLWEVHNQFEEISVHLAIDPSQTLFATFAEYPTKWTFKENFDFGAVKTVELGDRASGWVGFTMRFWYYRSPEGRSRLRGIFEWCDGESYHRYSGWMRMMSQAVLFDAPEEEADLRELHRVLKDVVVHWYSAHLERTPEAFVAHLKETYPKGASYAKESYR
ncbi:MAG TPA: hypothetical protein VMG36_00830 [Thermoplasmata archaeon]|nr:hypothetical protein [Thermoplasmata archaeon]